MLAEDGATSRMGLLNIILTTVAKLQNDLMGIIPYASTAYTYLPLTNDLSAITLFLDDLFVGMIGSSGSNITNALQVLAKSISSQGDQPSTVIIFTDGEFSSEINEKIDAILNSKQIDTVVVGVGSLQGEPIPYRNNGQKEYKKDKNGGIVISKRNDLNLERLAEFTNGIVVNGGVTPIVAEKIYVHLSNLETQQLEQKQKVSKIDRYHGLLIIVLILMVLNFIFPQLYLNYGIKSIILLLALQSMNVFAGHPGNNAYFKEDYDRAKSEYSKALKKHPDNSKINYNLGNVFFKEKEYDKAVMAYNEAIPKLSTKKQIAAYYNLGTAYLHKKDIKQAIDAYKEVLIRDPNHVKTRENIELALRQLNQQTQASQGTNKENDDKSSDGEQESQNNVSDELEEGMVSSEEKQLNEDNEASMKPSEKNELNEQQIQVLVDNAEREARQKKEKNLEALFQGAEW